MENGVEARNPHCGIVVVLCACAALVGGMAVHADTCTLTNVVVAPLTDAHWTQNAPYNDYSPKGTTVYTSGWKAGCVATAAAQELYYWQWPWRLDAVHESSHPVMNESNLSLRFDGNVPFDWENMPPSFSGRETFTQSNAVARLVLACQSLVQMQFVSGGGEAMKNLPGTMEWYEYAGQVTPRASDANLAALKADFEFGSPVQTGINFKGYGGHEVVGLGYATGTNSVGEAKNLIWLNLGWGGGSDGWYDIGETDSSETIIKATQLGFRPIKSVQIEPLAPISGSSVTLNWHLPNCYTNKISGFTVAKKRLSASTTTWSDDFSTGGKGRSSNTNEIIVTNGRLYGWQGTASGIYTYDEVLLLTEDSVLSYKVHDDYMSGMSVRVEAKVGDGGWQTISEPTLHGGWGPAAVTETVGLGVYADKGVRFRFVVEYVSGSIWTTGVNAANVWFDDVSISNVKTFETVSTYDTIAASARSATFSDLSTGETYAFAVTPIMSDGSAAVTQTAATTIGTPAAAPTINAVTMTPRGANLVQEGFYADIAMGWNVIDVACENVATLEAFPSHQSVLPQNKVEVVDNRDGSFSINIDANEVASKWANQKMILTLKATNATGESAYKDLELCLKASGVPVSFPDANVWTASGSDWYDTASYWSKGRVPNASDQYVVFSRTGNTEVYITDSISLDTVAIEGAGSLKFVDFFYGGASVSIQTLLPDASFTIDAAITDIGEIRPLTAVSSGDIYVSSGKSATIAGGKTWTIGGGVYLGGAQTLAVDGTLTTAGTLAAEGTGTVLVLAPTATVSAASLSFANNTIRLAMRAEAAPTLSVSSVATLTGATIEVSLADGMTAGDSIALMSAGSFVGVDSATLDGLDGYSLEVTGGMLYAKKEGEAPTVEGPVPVAVWDGDFSPGELTKFSGYELVDWQQTHGENDSSITIDRDNQGLFVDFTSAHGYYTVLVQYSGLAPSTLYKRVLFATTANADHTRNRCGIRQLTDGTIKGLWNSSTTANNDADYGSASAGTAPSSGILAFVYDKTTGTGVGGLSVYAADIGVALPDSALWSNTALKSGDNYGFALGGNCRGASASGVEAAKGMTITRLAIFTNVLTVAEMNAYKWPSEAVAPVADDERDPVDGNEMTRLNGKVFCGNDANRAVITNYLSQMEGTRPVSNPAPCSVDVLLVYDKNAANYVRGLGMTLEEHGARGVAVMNQSLIPTEIDTNAWFRLVGVYPIDAAATSVDDAMALAQAGTAPGWDTVHDERDRVGADIVISVVMTNSNYGLAYRCNPHGIRNGSEAPWAYAGVRADAFWAWAHETGHLASLYHNAGEAANMYNDPQYAGCGFVKTARDGTELRSLMDSGTAQMAFSSPNHLCHGEVYSVTNAAGRWVDSSGVLAELLPYMAKYRETKVPETPTLRITPASGSSVTKGTKMTVSYGDPEATIWYSRYGEEAETQYDGPVLIDNSAAYCIYVVTAKKNGEIVGTEAVAYIVVEKTTATTEFPVPYSWIEACFPGIEGYPDSMYETMAKSPGDNGYKYWESYVLGLDPTNALSKFTATIRMEGQKPIVEFSPTNETLIAAGKIEYVLQGKPTLTNDWQGVEFAAPGDTNRFFRVKVTW